MDFGLEGRMAAVHDPAAVRIDQVARDRPAPADENRARRYFFELDLEVGLVERRDRAVRRDRQHVHLPVRRRDAAPTSYSVRRCCSCVVVRQWIVDTRHLRGMYAAADSLASYSVCSMQCHSVSEVSGTCLAEALAVADRRPRRGFRDRARAEVAVARKRAVHGRRPREHRDVHAGGLAAASPTRSTKSCGGEPRISSVDGSIVGKSRRAKRWNSHVSIAPLDSVGSVTAMPTTFRRASRAHREIPRARTRSTRRRVDPAVLEILRARAGHRIPFLGDRTTEPSSSSDLQRRASRATSRRPRPAR